MVDYAPDIIASDYLYIREISITEKSGEDLVDFPVKLTLNSSNFNFSLADKFISGLVRVNLPSMTHSYIGGLFDGDPLNCSDGDYETYCRFNSIPVTWIVDLGSGNTWSIKALRLRLWKWAADTNRMIKDFEVGGSNNGTDWTVVYSGTAAKNGDLQQFNFAAETNFYRYYRVHILSNYGGAATSLGLIDLVPSGALDFCLAEKGNGTQVLNMWGARWDTVAEAATLFFKLPSLLANETKSLYAYWGNPTTSGISDIDSVGFMLGDEFNDATTYNNNWSVGGNATVSMYFGGDEGGHTSICVINQPNLTGYVQTKNDPIEPLSSWAVEIGFWMYASTINHTAYYSHRINFYGAGVPDAFNYFSADGQIEADPDGDGEEYGERGARTENLQYCGATYPDNYWGYQWGGLVPESYHQHFFGYYLPTEAVYKGMYDRDTTKISSSCPAYWNDNYEETFERRINNNSDHTRLRIWGAARSGLSQYHGTNAYMDWVVIRKFLGPYEPEWNLTNLYVQYEQVNPEALEYGFGSDVTDVNFTHITYSGGEPTRLSDNQYGSLVNTWCSDDGMASGEGIDLYIHFNSWGNNLVDSSYLHYDDGHVLYLNASKMSDSDDDVHGNNYWKSTTTSGWACIDFGSNINNVTSCSIRAVAADLNCCPKTYKFEGSYIYHNDWEHEDWKVLAEGQFEKTASWQNIYVGNEVKYRFYRLRVFDVYGGSCIKIQEWEMYNYNAAVGKKIVSKLRLKPADFDSQYLYFPKQIGFYGSNDLSNWDTLIDTKKTYTPLDGKWQEYVFTNLKKYYYYKLRAIGNWNNNSGKICIAEWEMMESLSESNIFRILDGSSNNFNSIWAQPDATFDLGEFYVVNEGLNVVIDNGLATYTVISGTVMDLNVY